MGKVRQYSETTSARLKEMNKVRSLRDLEKIFGITAKSIQAKMKSHKYSLSEIYMIKHKYNELKTIAS